MTKDRDTTRDDRLAAALRANLKRRKAQSRARQPEKTEAETTEAARQTRQTGQTGASREMEDGQDPD
ncbi:MAG: hypothetical protein AAFS07_03120 [Pseudomonadota bacterium]